jgi:hypothetical protein
MAEEELFQFDDEQLDEIDYFEIVSLEEIIKLNPTFVAFSNEEIYNYLFNWFIIPPGHLLKIIHLYKLSSI